MKYKLAYTTYKGVFTGDTDILSETFASLKLAKKDCRNANKKLRKAHLGTTFKLKIISVKG